MINAAGYDESAGRVVLDDRSGHPGIKATSFGYGKINDEKSKLVGDVLFSEVEHKVSAISPVPGGVGPMTIACLLRNTTAAFKLKFLD